VKIALVDLGLQHKKLKKDILRSVEKVIARGDFILGEDVKLFEQEFAKFCGSDYCVGVSSGTAALFLALSALGIKDGDEVIVPAFTYIATALAVSYTGARPVFVDVDEKTYNLNPSLLEKAITPKTKAVIPVHLYGQPACMPQIMRIAGKYNLKVIEDTAQAHGANMLMPDGKKHLCGSIGDIGCFSFYPSKNLGALGDGGAITTNSKQIYDKLNMLRDYGRASKYEHVMVGYNSRLDTLQAGILRYKLRKLQEWNNWRIKAAGWYNKLLSGIDGITTPFAQENSRHVYHVYAVQSHSRDKLSKYLSEKGIGVIVHYPIPVHLQKAYEGLGYKKGDFPVSEKLSERVLSLPLYPYITQSQVKKVVGTIKEVI
jgi:dTDP-4-amino-4,6-dideoxygalactose transaminase